MHEADRSTSIQLLILVILGTLFIWCLLTQAPTQDRFLVYIGLPLFVVAYFGGRALGPTDDWKDAVLLVMVVPVALWLPLTFNPPIAAASVIAAVIGNFTTVGLWAIHRYPKRDAEPSPLLKDSPGEAVIVGAIAGAAFAAFGTLMFGVLAIIAAIVGAEDGPEILPLLGYLWGGYVGGGLAAGSIAALLRPINKWPLGTMLTGVVGTTIVFAALMPVVTLIEGQSVSMKMMVATPLAGGLIGPAVGLGLREATSLHHLG
jgi:hypothetical protein